MILNSQPSSGVIRFKSALVALTGTIIFAATYLLAVTTKFGQSVEQRVLDQASFSVDPLLPLAAVQPVLIIFALLAITLVAFFKVGIIRSISVWFIAGFSLLGAQVLKIMLPRFDLIRSDVDPIAIENTLPSGHMSVFVTISLLALMFLPQQITPLFFWLSMLVLSVVSWQLLDYGWHRPSDLIAAVAAVIGVFGIICFAFPSILSYRASSGLTPRSKIFLVTVSGFLTTVTIVLTLGAVAVMVITGFSNGKAAISLALTATVVITYLLFLSFRSLLALTSMR